jgi:hypothetical protein
MSGRGVLSFSTILGSLLLRVSLDEVELRQVDTRKWLAFDSPFKLGICQSQIEYFQDVFHLETCTS